MRGRSAGTMTRLPPLHPLRSPGAGLSPFTRSRAQVERGLQVGGHETFIMGLEYQGGCQDLSRTITFKKYHPVLLPNESMDSLSCFVHKPSVLCARPCHEKPPGTNVFVVENKRSKAESSQSGSPRRGKHIEQISTGGSDK